MMCKQQKPNRNKQQQYIDDTLISWMSSLFSALFDDDRQQLTEQ